MSLYLWLDLLSVSVPLLVSFHPRIRLYRHWKGLFMAIFVTMVPYIIWDVYFTRNGYWGFNAEYLNGLYWLDLPVEEWLFFICIPYACVFTHVALLELWPKLKLGEGMTKYITFVLLGIFAFLLFLNLDLAYTSVDMIFGLLALILAFLWNKELLRSFFITFLFMLIPFFMVNGVLTGTAIPGNVVWYNDEQNLGIRLGTIPVEDTVYAFSLILFNLLLFQAWSGKKQRPSL